MNAALKRAVLASAVGFAVAFAAGCGGNNNNNNNPPTCDANSCPTGCCDSTGTCQLGTTASACGRGGGQCLTCLTTQTCSNQVCAAGAGGGAGGGSGGGSGGGAGGGAGGGSGGTLVGDAGVDALLAGCAAGKTAFCSYLARCGFGSTVAGLCEEAIDRGDIYVNTCTDLQLQVSIQQGRVGVDTSVLQSCTAALATAPCDKAVLKDNGPFETVCKNAIVPKVQPGGACTLHGLLECANGFCDTENGVSCPSTCSPKVAAGADAGDSFVFDFNPCVDGYYPYDVDGTGTYFCSAFVDAGASCAPSANNGFEEKLCAKGSWCDDTGVVETCAPLLLADAGCDSDDQCAPDLMCNNSFCRPVLPGTNTPCSDSTTLLTYGCKVGLFCDDPNFTGGVCKAPGALGAVCDTANLDIDCRTAGYCDDPGDGGMACVPKRTSGLCNGSECATGYFCDFNTGTCKAQGGLDAGCDADDAECQPGLACGASDTCVLPYSCP